MKKTISHAVFGKLSRYDDHVYSTVHWASQLVQIVIYASDQTSGFRKSRSVSRGGSNKGLQTLSFLKNYETNLSNHSN